MAKQEVTKEQTTNQKLTQEELEKIDNIGKNRNTLVTELGQIKLAEINLEKRTDAAEAYMDQLNTQENELAKYLEAKYGNGSVDIKTGEFIPS